MENLKLALYGIAFALGVMAGWYPTHAHYALKIARQTERDQQAAITAQQRAAQTERHDQLLTETNSHDLQIRLNAIDSQFDAALLQHTAAPDHLPGIADSQPGHSCTAHPDRLSWADKQFLLGLAKQADEQTARLVACQNWLKEHGEAQ